MNTYTLGSSVRISLHFTNIAGVDTDPTTVTLYVKDPHGVSTTYTYAAVQISKDATGRYHYDVNANIEGVWYYRGEGAGAIQAAVESSFEVLTIFNLGTC